ncbi:beta-lactamase class C AmpC-like protein [Psychroflexus torquis ATCC 700755]|uniref:Beta-lactamase class C AmpC-like protein n=1 Tax=Psychroflexus torquis (strain ATCC 700755 / CIP 106069 / ACAM 623) TaxID=313595 RepID=K4IJ27_PSYTT|nr:serine hydrolase domain-containing protein [Psychroflexus torquis]AFU70542.1 beta-lactamase class C AmpC-like protein [Psychroflexus torquis ATCC 700755]
MKNKFILILILLSIISSITNKVIAQKNYKGGTKHMQPEIESLPNETIYIFDKRLNDTLEIKLNQKIDELFGKYDIAGITATILIPKKGIWETNRGFISKPENIVIDSSSVFYWASVSKLITSTIIHQLVSEGSLSFDDKLSKWYPNIQYSKKITIEQLLTHTNGIYSFNSDSTIHFSNKHFNPDELLNVAKSKKNLFKPSEYWSYTNTGYLLLALITEKIESKTFSQIIKDRISEPLNLKSLKTATENSLNLALAHNKDSVKHKDYSVPLGAGNMISNSKDMAIFLSALLTGKIIPIKDVHNMMKDLYPMFDKGQYYGKGIMLYDFNDVNQTDNSWIGHSGGTENYKAIVAYDIQTKAIITISINENIPVEAVAYKLMELINE